MDRPATSGRRGPVHNGVMKRPLSRWTLVLAGIALVAIGIWVLIGVQPASEIDRVVAWGSVMAAIATISLAAVTVAAVLAARGTVIEMQRSRVFEFRPHLIVNEGEQDPGPPPSRKVNVTNIGRGPALDCRVAVHWILAAQGDWWGVSRGFELGTLGPTHTVERPVIGKPNDKFAPSLVGDVMLTGAGQAIAVVYRDLLDNRYRLFGDLDHLTTEVVEAASAAPPKWATWVERERQELSEES